MANRLKEDERNERIIRNLLKLPENRRCINCNSLGPQYVCTNFSTFVCTACSGIHREFTHRVKSVSMAKFTPQEVSALQEGGNASAREIYLKEWDSQRNSLPDGSNIDRLRDFIKHVYVDRRYSGERNMEKPPRAKTGENEDLAGNRRIDYDRGGSRSPPTSGGMSPGYSPDTRNNSDYKKSPARPEVINDWRREDRFGNGRKPEERNSDVGSKPGSRSPDIQRDMDSSSPPIVRPVREILGDAVSPLRVIEPPKVTVAKVPQGLSTQRTASSSSLASSDASSPAIKVEASFIDFDSVPEPSITETAPKPNQPATDTSSLQQTASSESNWANFDSVSEVKPQTTASNSVESILSALSVPAPAPSSSVPVNMLPPQSSGGLEASFLDSSFGTVAPPPVQAPTSGIPSSTLGSSPQFVNAGANMFANAHAGGQWPPQQHSGFSGNITQPVPHIIPSTNVGSTSNKPWNAPVGPDVATVAKPDIAQDTKAAGRKALPEDLFTMSYSYAPHQIWYPGAPYAGGMPMHYNMPMQQAVPNFQPVSRSTNPFDFGNEPPVQAPTFPSMASLQGALPNTMTPTPPPYASATPPSSFVGQELAAGKISRPPLPSGFGLDHSAFASQNSNQQLGGAHPNYSTASHFSSSSGNPFG